MTTMKESKGKGIVSDEVAHSRDEAIDQTRPPISSTMKLIPLTSLEKRKTMSKRLDTGNLSSHQGNKKQKVDSSTPSITPVVVLDLLVPMAKSRADTFLMRLDVDQSKPSPLGPPNSGPMTLLRSEGLAWDRFKQAVTDTDIAIFYDMSVKEFEQSIIPDLFKVLQLVLSLKKFKLQFFFISRPCS